MLERIFSRIMLALFLTAVFSSALSSHLVEASETIYIRANGEVEPLTAPISSDDNITYTLTGNIDGAVVIERSNIMIDGNGFTIQGDGDLDGVYLGSVDNVTIENVTVELFDNGIYCNNSSGSWIVGNNITNNTNEGIILENSSSISIFGNRINHSGIDPSYCGIDLSYSPNCSIWKNNMSASFRLSCSSNCNISENIIGGWGRILLSGSSYVNVTRNRNSGDIRLSNTDFCTICGNSGTIYLFSTMQSVIRDNNATDGIQLWYSNFNVVVGNNITTPFMGVSCWRSQYNSFYHNNFINNARPVYSDDMGANSWDDGLEGNYWSNYNGTDSDHDGIGDAPYKIDNINQDNHPLMGMFNSFETSLNYDVDVISNSTIEDFEFLDSSSTIKMHASNMTANQTYGFCRICIPHALMNVSNLRVIIDDGLTVVSNQNFTLYDNGTHRWIYFAYPHSTHQLVIAQVPEGAFPIWIVASAVLAFGVGVTVLVYFLRSRRRLKSETVAPDMDKSLACDCWLVLRF